MSDIKFFDIVKHRYAVKKFDGRKLPEGKVSELLELVRLAPSSFNLQPWKIIVAKDAQTKAKLAPAAYNQLQITTSSHLLVFCADTDIMSLVHELEKGMKAEDSAKNETIDPYIGMMKGFVNSMNDEQKLAWAQRQVYLALGNALNGAKALGFDSCPMEGFNPQEFAKILKLPANIVPTALCPIGYAADTPKPKLRFAKERIVVPAN